MFKKVSVAFILIATPLFSVLVNQTPVVLAETLAQKVNCNKAVTTPELKYCSQLSYQAADKKLNQTYQKIIPTLNSEQRRSLISAQKAWIQFRDNNCNFETYASRGGTGYEIFRNGCLQRLTEQRTKDFENFLSNR
ncbi:MAG: lysozyme inhibitor LprI family protein [Scytonema sp. PMC 1069.18]|nr:lysozyme inhibitor LprI family protein [Scytonema sp. PMC 1069.18]MEC4887334.1 lysozyme inhibitor LprI family protein [Scytonema sp. PMC 1070.18]